MWDDKNATDLARQMVQWRREFHQNPELSGQEQQTSLAIAGILKDMEIEAHTFQDNYGVYAIIKGKYSGPTIAFRADMDALPVTEENDVPYQSTHTGIMHACGHDGHMAILLGLARIFSECQHELAGTIKFIFQPSEEAAPVGGAKSIIKEGVLADVQAIFGLHLWPDLPCGHIGIRKGSLMAASDRLTIKILGQGAHAGQPHHGVDAITIAADVIEGLGHIMSRQLDPLETATISIGTIKGGERYNVVAREVVLEGTVRTLGEEVRQEIPKKVERLLAGMAAAQGGSYTIDYGWGYPVLSNCAELTEVVINAAQKVIGDQGVHTDVNQAMTAEDFGNYLTKIPGAFFWLGCGKTGKKNGGLHTSCFDIDEDVLLIGAKIMYQTGCLALAHYGGTERVPENSVTKHST